MHGSITEQTIRDRMRAWGVPRRLARLPMSEIVRLTAMTENKLNWKLRKHRGQR